MTTNKKKKHASKKSASASAANAAAAAAAAAVAAAGPGAADGSEAVAGKKAAAAGGGSPDGDKENTSVADIGIGNAGGGAMASFNFNTAGAGPAASNPLQKELDSMTEKRLALLKDYQAQAAALKEAREETSVAKQVRSPARPAHARAWPPTAPCGAFLSDDDADGRRSRAARTQRIDELEDLLRKVCIVAGASVVAVVGLHVLSRMS